MRSNDWFKMSFWFLVIEFDEITFIREEIDEIERRKAAMKIERCKKDEEWE